MSLVIHEELEQGSEAWHAARRGIITASVIGRLITAGAPDALAVDCPTCGTVAGTSCISLAAKKLRTEIKTIHEARTALAANLPPVYAVANNDTSRGITATLAAERITGWTEETPMTSDMWRGCEVEPIARDAYAKRYGPVEEIGFMRLDEDCWSLGYSPDGLVGDDGLLEIKAPRAKSHVLTVIAGEVPPFYMPQLQAGLLVSGRKWIDFVPYVGGLPMFTKRVYPDPAWFDVIRAAAEQFEKTAAEMVAAYNQATTDLPATERVDSNALGLVF